MQSYWVDSELIISSQSQMLILFACPLFPNRAFIAQCRKGGSLCLSVHQASCNCRGSYYQVRCRLCDLSFQRLSSSRSAKLQEVAGSDIYRSVGSTHPRSSFPPGTSLWFVFDCQTSSHLGKIASTFSPEEKTPPICKYMGKDA